MFGCTESSQSSDNPFQLPLRSVRIVTWHEQSSQKLKRCILIAQFHKNKALITL